MRRLIRYFERRTGPLDWVFFRGWVYFAATLGGVVLFFSAFLPGGGEVHVLGTLRSEGFDSSRYGSKRVWTVASATGATVTFRVPMGAVFERGEEVCVVLYRGLLLPELSMFSDLADRERCDEGER